MSDVDAHYGTLARLIALRDLLIAGECDRQRIFTQLDAFYPPKPGSAKKLSRDLQSLQAFGYELLTQKAPLRWRIIPHLMLNDADIQTLRIIHDTFSDNHPFSEQCRQFVFKLTQDLSPVQQNVWNRLVFATHNLVPVRNYAAHSAVINLLTQAIERRRQVRFLYTAQAGTRLWHTVDPYQIELRDRQYYLEAYSYSSAHIRTFRIDRIETSDHAQSPEILATMQNLPRQRPQIEFVYQLSHALAADGVSARFAIEKIKPVAAGVLVYASDSSELYIVRTLLAYGSHVVLVDGPPALLERFRAEIRQLHANHMP